MDRLGGGGKEAIHQRGEITRGSTNIERITWEYL